MLMHMRNLFLSLIFFGAAIYVGSILFDRFSASDANGAEETLSPVGEGSDAILSYPADLTLEHKDGRRIDVTLVGRSSDTIQFQRAGDGRMFEFPIADLTKRSQGDVRGFPVSGYTSTRASSGTESVSSVQALHEQNLKKRIAQIDAECVQLEQGYRASHSTVERRTLMRKYEDLQRERQGLQEDLAN
ncbi:hypothetical protein Caka_1710 [Coraliomargarita akajimensis DSM 45221]|uniref:Uncharacterized protein n=2 Tax=Coraliomargarita TaxID=442430 RepID=D5EJY0_CORAD|nr:hypothetical protein Caka_1710 [Coraliomargarita akajimensis DSM 45221]